MGSELYRMIRDGAPADWTPAMILVAAMIADDARDPSQGMPEDGKAPWSSIPVAGKFTKGRKGKWRDGLTERTGMSPKVIQRVLADLGRAGYEMREQIGTDKIGRPVYGVKGRAVNFRVPTLKPRDSPPRWSDPSTLAGKVGGQIRPPKRRKGGHRRPPKGHIGGQIGPPFPPKDLPPKDLCPPTHVVDPVNGPVEGNGEGETEMSDQHSQDQHPGDDSTGKCPECGQQAETMRSMGGPVMRSHSRDHPGEAYCPGTGQPPVGAR